MGNRDSQALGIIIISGSIGLILAYLLGELNTDAILVDDYITATFTIIEVQTVVILICLLIGLILAARR